MALWIGLLLEGKFDTAARIARDLQSTGYAMHVSRSLEDLREYVRSRYEGDSGKRSGLLASSKFRKLAPLGIRAAMYPYYCYGQRYEAPPNDPRPCCQVDLAVSEFGSQGLELDMPILCWGPDLVPQNGRCVAKAGRSRDVRDPQRIRINAYRVLPRRGRYGILIFVPPELDSAHEAILRAGVPTLP